MTRTSVTLLASVRVHSNNARRTSKPSKRGKNISHALRLWLVTYVTRKSSDMTGHFNSQLPFILLRNSPGLHLNLAEYKPPLGLVILLLIEEPVERA